MHPYFQVGRIPDNPGKSHPAIRKARMQNEGYGIFFLDFFFFFSFSRNTKPIEYYSVAAIRAVFNLIRRIRRVHVGGDERINMPGINQSEDRSPYFSWRNSVFEFLSRPGRIQANTKYSPGKKGHLHSAYIRGKSIRRMPPSPPQSPTETRVLREVYVNWRCDINHGLFFSLFLSLKWDDCLRWRISVKYQSARILFHVNPLKQQNCCYFLRIDRETSNK